MKRNLIREICIFAFLMNFLLFAVKLYVGLSSNSIGIFSDAVNSLSDSLSGLLTFICMAFAMRMKDPAASLITHKTEQLCSFIMAIAITFTGLYFAYSSLERFMYPTALWYTNVYLAVLLSTAGVKLVMFFILRQLCKKEKSPVAKLMMTDSLLDCCITCVTALSLYVSYKGTYSFDAAAGLIISVIITVTAVKTVVSSGSGLINRVPYEKREEFYTLLKDAGLYEKITSVQFITTGEGTVAYVSVSPENEALFAPVINSVKEKTEINLKTVKED